MDREHPRAKDVSKSSQAQDSLASASSVMIPSLRGVPGNSSSGHEKCRLLDSSNVCVCVCVCMSVWRRLWALRTDYDILIPQTSRAFSLLLSLQYLRNTSGHIKVKKRHMQQVSARGDFFLTNAGTCLHTRTNAHSHSAIRSSHRRSGTAANSRAWW